MSEIQKSKEARREGSTLFEGMVSLRAVLTSPLPDARKIEEVFYDEARAKKEPREYAFLRAKASERGFALTLLPRGKIDEMTLGTTHGGVAARCSDRRLPRLDGKDVTDGGFYCMLDGIEDPFNFGYALRSIAAAGANGVILSERNWMSAAGTVCRSSAGASESIPMYVCDALEAAKLFREKDYKIVCSDIENSTPLFDADMKKPLLLIVGGEKRGISRSLLDACDEIVRIPYGCEYKASLSAASAAAILAFEVVRQNT